MSPVFGAADLDALLADMGVPVTIGGTTVKGLFDIVDRVMLTDAGGELVGKELSVVVKTGALTGLADGAAITIDGGAYVVTGVAQFDDGAYSRAVLAPA